jgi:predicted DNA-binding antitoxin AbrB/MazE fold protein
MERQTVRAVYENGVFRPVTMVFDLQEGQQVILTVRPEPQLDPAEEKRREEELLREMEADGFLETTPVPVDGPPPADFQPLAIEGEPLSETIIKNRR